MTGEKEGNEESTIYMTYLLLRHELLLHVEYNDEEYNILRELTHENIVVLNVVRVTFWH